MGHLNWCLLLDLHYECGVELFFWTHGDYKIFVAIIRALSLFEKNNKLFDKWTK